MKIEYDESVDALAISFADNPRNAHTKEVAEGINLDFNSRGKLVMIEVLDASRFAPREKLRKLPSARRDLTLTEAAEESELSADTLRSLIHKKRLPATKIGRDWMVTLADLYNYLESRDTRGGGKRRELARAS